MEEKELLDWVNKNYKRNPEPLYAWVDAQDLIDFIKSKSSN